MIQHEPQFAKKKESATLILDFLFMQPITGISEISHQQGKAFNSVNRILEQFVSLGIVSKSTLRKRNKEYRFDAYLALLEKEL